MIYVELNEANFEYDIYSLIKAFYPGEDIKFSTDCKQEPEQISYRYVVDYEENEINIAVYQGEKNLRGELVCKETGDKTVNDDMVETCDKTANNDMVEICINKRVVITGCERKEVKNRLKLALYHMLVELTNKQLPWGTLTGIRPTKIPLHMLENGSSRQDIYEYMKTTYEISDEKEELCYSVAEREFSLLKPIDYKNGFSLYIGIPFCPSTCLYCSFTSYPVGIWKKRMDEYLDALDKEIDFVAKHFAGRPLQTIYIGGGTPTSLSAQQLERLFKKIESSLDLSQILEFTVEAGRPDSITREKLETIYAHGIRRISINPQTMNQKTLDLIGRHHSVEQIRDSFAMARQVGFENINMDLIVGLPGESIEDVAYTLSEVMKMNPDNLTVHSLAIKRSARLNIEWDKYQNMQMENSDLHMELAKEAAQKLGMTPYYLYRQKNMAGNMENIGFAKEGKAGLYNVLIMEEKQTILALGAGAACKFVYDENRIERCENVKDVGVYLDRIDEMIERKRVATEAWKKG